MIIVGKKATQEKLLVVAVKVAGGCLVGAGNTHVFVMIIMKQNVPTIQLVAVAIK